MLGEVGEAGEAGNWELARERAEAALARDAENSDAAEYIRAVARANVVDALAERDAGPAASHLASERPHRRPRLRLRATLHGSYYS